MPGHAIRAGGGPDARSAPCDGADPSRPARAGAAYHARVMTPALLLILLLSSLLATVPVARLHRAGWPSGALLTAWLIYVAGILMGLEVGFGSRLLLPLLIVLFVLPFAAGQPRLERAGRLLGGRRAPGRHVINVTPPGGVEPTSPPTAKRRGRKPPVEYR
jgi:hypothetical protein